MDGKVVIETNGDITTTGEIKVKKLNIDNLDTTTASIGTGTIPAGETNVVINTTAVNNTSRIFVTATSATGKQTLIVPVKTAGRSFTVKIEEAYTDDITFNWWIVN